MIGRRTANHRRRDVLSSVEPSLAPTRRMWNNSYDWWMDFSKSQRQTTQTTPQTRPHR